MYIYTAGTHSYHTNNYTVYTQVGTLRVGGSKAGTSLAYS
ncbi:hypothetical protein BACI71_40373 [Bacillus mycoides]|uniref:Uncharacterized protein n=1 Tax=Bacillus mycoides TaxID=1405 RepID=A0A653ZY76_BACMY|nr:hypothetical protein BACI71_40373 [Bacillus mycoides]